MKVCTATCTNGRSCTARARLNQEHRSERVGLPPHHYLRHLLPRYRYLRHLCPSVAFPSPGRSRGVPARAPTAVGRAFHPAAGGGPCPAESPVVR
jgi:hypothetical protein